MPPPGSRDRASLGSPPQLLGCVASLHGRLRCARDHDRAFQRHDHEGLPRDAVAAPGPHRQGAGRRWRPSSRSCCCGTSRCCSRPAPRSHGASGSCPCCPVRARAPGAASVGCLRGPFSCLRGPFGRPPRPAEQLSASGRTLRMRVRCGPSPPRTHGPWRSWHGVGEDCRHRARSPRRERRRLRPTTSRPTSGPRRPPVSRHRLESLGRQRAPSREGRVCRIGRARQRPL